MGAVLVSLSANGDENQEPTTVATAEGGSQQPETRQTRDDSSVTQEKSEFSISEAELRERAEARWAALTKGDFAAAYEYETPGYRDTMTPRRISIAIR